MTGSEVLARWNTLTPAERDAWVAERCMDMSLMRCVNSAEYVTHEMAMDAGDRSLEGSLYRAEEWEPVEPPPFTQDNNAAISVAEKLGLTLLPVRDLADEDNPKLLGWIATDHPVAMGDWADGPREVLLAIDRFLPAELVQPTPAAAICLAGLAYVEGGEG